MNRDIASGQWKQLKGRVIEQWGRITDDEFDRMSGKRERLIGAVQEKYGKARDEAEREVSEFLDRISH